MGSVPLLLCFTSNGWRGGPVAEPDPIKIADTVYIDQKRAQTVFTDQKVGGTIYVDQKRAQEVYR